MCKGRDQEIICSFRRGVVNKFMSYYQGVHTHKRHTYIIPSFAKIIYILSNFNLSSMIIIDHSQIKRIFETTLWAITRH